LFKESDGARRLLGFILGEVAEQDVRVEDGHQL
jgi:hypothetical protein